MSANKEQMPFKIIWLSGMPRSGTNWLSQIFDSNEDVNFKLAPLFSYAFRNRVNRESTREEWVSMFSDLYHSDDPFVNQLEKRKSGKFPFFTNKRSHPSFLVIKETRYHELMPVLLELFSHLRIIYIVRNPCGAIYSWLSNPKEFPAGADMMKEWKTGNCKKQSEGEYWGFDDWKSVTQLYLALEKSHPQQVKVISYEDLVNEPLTVTGSMFAFTELELSEETKKFISASQAVHSDDEFAVFKNKEVKDKWRGHLDERIITAIRNDLEGTALEVYVNK